jgi:peptidoglycan/LPS O-acetylase OafA/YrhL
LWERQGKESPSLFFINRFLRIWPLYIVVLLLSAWMLHRPLSLVNFTILGVASSDGIRPLGVEWSLDIEVQFYLLLPLIFVMKPPGWLWAPATILGWALFYWTGIFSILMYLPAFSAGIMIYKNRGNVIPTSAYTSLLVFVALAGVLMLFPYGRAMLSKELPSVFRDDIFAMVWGATLIPYIAHSLRLKSDALDRHLGNMSYPLYLLHEPILQYAHPNGFMEKSLAVIVILVATVLTYVIVEMPFETLRYRLLAFLSAKRAKWITGQTKRASTASDFSLGKPMLGEARDGLREPPHQS